MKTYCIMKTIHARADTVWAILTDSSGYSDWNVSVEKIEGDIALGKKIKVYAKVSPGRAFPVTVKEFVPGKKMVWHGGMPFGLFIGTRTFTLSGNSEGPIEFQMKEEFSGFMSPLILRSMPDLTEPFEQFASSLKAKAERVV